MGILFKDVYSKAVSLFEDPKITAAYKSNTVQFEKIMYTYLQNAIGMFHNPASIGMALANYNIPIGKMESFEADGNTKEFTLDNEMIIEGKEELNPKGFNYVFIENDRIVQGEYIVDETGDTAGKVVFPDILPEGQQYAFEIYYSGEFTNNFGGTRYNKNTTNANSMIVNTIKDILARLLVRSWAEDERNMVLDIRNIMQDTDFKLMSNDKILNAKNKWIDQLDDEVFQMQNRLAWTIRFAGSATNIGRG